MIETRQRRVINYNLAWHLPLLSFWPCATETPYTKIPPPLPPPPPEKVVPDWNGELRSQIRKGSIVVWCF